MYNTAVLCSLLFNLHHEIVAQIQMVVNVFLSADLLYLLLLFMLRSPSPIHSLSSISRLDVLFLLGPTLVHHFLLSIHGLLPGFVFHASLCLLDHGNGSLILFWDPVTI
jgi:hypothetical protein